MTCIQILFMLLRITTSTWTNPCNRNPCGTSSSSRSSSSSYPSSSPSASPPPPSRFFFFFFFFFFFLMRQSVPRGPISWINIENHPNMATASRDQFFTSFRCKETAITNKASRKGYGHAPGWRMLWIMKH